MKILMVLVLGVLVVSAATAKAGVDGEAVLGGALGGGAGAAVGSAIGGRNGAIIGGAVGGAAGVAVATSDRRREVVVVHEDERHDNGRHLGQYKNKHKHGRHDD